MFVWTGALYDQTAEEKEESQQKNLEMKVYKWAKTMAREELDGSEWENVKVRMKVINRHMQYIRDRIQEEDAIRALYKRSKNDIKENRISAEIESYEDILKRIDKLRNKIKRSSSEGSERYNRSMQGYTIDIDKLERSMKKLIDEAREERQRRAQNPNKVYGDDPRRISDAVTRMKKIVTGLD